MLFNKFNTYETLSEKSKSLTFISHRVSVRSKCNYLIDIFYIQTAANGIFNWHLCIQTAANGIF